ncbi:long-chain-fatty-acid--CoA ligase [Shouchella shacheensis]|uniref:long-chain-fatty-acid--CoA ligase n=1 Tax=Shouchella shacheensis TaxID=1649580 RepID=UPI00074002E6|nr:long-chain-fatty-acid--CoA ligase [Shouchella shacheensis]
MNKRHYEAWPPGLTKTLTIPETTVYDNLLVATKRYPTKTAIHYYGNALTYEELLEQVEHLAGFLQRRLHIKVGDRVLLYMQNSPQYVIATYAILRIGAVVVPSNPMNKEAELEFHLNDCEVEVAIAGQELYENLASLQGRTTLREIIVTSYATYLPKESEIVGLPDEVTTPEKEDLGISWSHVLNEKVEPSTYVGSNKDLAALPYTSGTTGLPKGCKHTHRSFQANMFGAAHWMNATSDSVHLATLPFFHVTGMLHSMHLPLLVGSSIVILTRWNRTHAAEMIERHKITNWVNISTMVVDFLGHPQLQEYDLSSLQRVAGGGAPLPEAVGEKLYTYLGLRYIEAYGLSETISHTHFNPPDAPKLQCLGVPSFDVDARVVDPTSLKELGTDEVGEIVINGPQLFEGYYHRPEETAKAFIELNGKRFFRTGDMAKFDEEGYFFMVDRVKRMINASGYKVWPSEVESLLYKHPAIEQACVIGVPDPVRGESVKALVILHSDSVGTVTENEIIEWSKEEMAAYKYPRAIEFRTSFPTTASGKILWRQLQEEAAREQVK